MNSKIRCILIEDEDLARDLVKNFLSKFSEIEIIGEFADGFSGLKAIQELKPDLIFLDIQMPKLTGFELLELLDEVPNIIFTTAYNQYAIKAFELNAIDYLLKPFAQDRFNDAVEKAIQRIQLQEKDKSQVEKLVKHSEEQNDELDRIVVKKSGNIHIIALEDIQFLEAQDDYVMIHTNSEKFMKQKTMKYFESHLPERDFCRVHRSYIVRIDQVHQLELYEKESYMLHLKSNSKIKVSKTGYKKLKEVLHF